MSDYSSGPAACAHGVLFIWSCQLCGRVGRTADHSPGAAVVIAQLTAERDSLAVDLAALRARIYAASSALRSELTLHCGSENVLTDGMKYALDILAPPEGPQ